MNRFLIFMLLAITLFTFSCQQERFVQGQRIYQIHCNNCHMDDGRGMGMLYPSLLESAYLRDSINLLPCLIIQGKRSDELATVEMPPNKSLSPAEMNNVINYVVSKWGSGKAVSPKQISNYLEDCQL